MKTLKEQIVEILDRKLSIKIENDFVRIGTAKIIADKILLLFKDYYPKEFIEWMMMLGIMGIPERRGILYTSGLLNLKGFKGDCTIENLFEYWQNNIKDK